jgi:hypothetical protein
LHFFETMGGLGRLLRPRSRAIACCAAACAVAACLPGEDVDLGRQLDASTSSAMDATTVPEPDGPDDDASSVTMVADAPLDGASDHDGRAGPSFCLRAQLDPDAGDAGPHLWSDCSGSPTAPATCVPPPNDISYIPLTVTYTVVPTSRAFADTTLCAPVVPGNEYFFTVEAAIDGAPLDGGAASTPLQLQLWGGPPCSNTSLLWTSSEIPRTCSWTTLCGAFVPTKAFTHLVLSAVPKSGGAPGEQTTLAVRHFASVAQCSPLDGTVMP